MQPADPALLCHDLGDDQAAREHGQEARRIALEIGDEDKQAHALTSLDHALAGLGTLQDARDAYERALTLPQRLKQPNQAVETLAGLVRLSLGQGYSTPAGARIEEITDYLEDSDLEGTVDPIAVCLTCHRVLQGGRDPRSREMLVTASDLLQKQASRSSDCAVRSSLPNNVAANREIMGEATRNLGGMHTPPYGSRARTRPTHHRPSGAVHVVPCYRNRSRELTGWRCLK